MLWATSEADVQAAGVSFHFSTLHGTVLPLNFWFEKAPTAERHAASRLASRGLAWRTRHSRSVALSS